VSFCNMYRSPSAHNEHVRISTSESQFKQRDVTSPIFLSPAVSTRLKPRLFDASTLNSAMPSARKVLFSPQCDYDHNNDPRTDMNKSTKSGESSSETRRRRELEESQVR
jgi:hypothetical protein